MPSNLTARRTSSRRRSLIEGLETRRLLAALTWDGGGDGTTWGDAQNWNVDRLPTKADDVVLDIVGDLNVVIDHGAQAGTLTNHETVVICRDPGSSQSGVLTIHEGLDNRGDLIFGSDDIPGPGQMRLQAGSTNVNRASGNIKAVTPVALGESYLLHRIYLDGRQTSPTTFTNRGQIEINEAASLGIFGPGLVDNRGVVETAASGRLTLWGLSFTSTGTHTGEPTFLHDVTELDLGAVKGDPVFVVSGVTNLISSIKSNTSIFLSDTNGFSRLILDPVSPTLRNEGQIVVESQFGNNHPAFGLTVAANARFLNDVRGSILFQDTLAGSIESEIVVSVEPGARLRNEGALDVVGDNLTVRIAKYFSNDCIVLGGSISVGPDARLKVVGDLCLGSEVNAGGLLEIASDSGESIDVLTVSLSDGLDFPPLEVSGQVTIGSTLNDVRLRIDQAATFDPVVGDSFGVITASGGITNAFDSFQGGEDPSGDVLAVSRPDGNTVAVAIVPGPLPPAPAPQILGQSFEFEERLAVTFDFDQDVSAFLSRSDYTITNVDTGETLPQSAGVLSFNTMSSQAVLDLLGDIPNGNYELVVEASDIANGAGVPASGAPITLEFFVLAGDANRDRTVNLADFGILRANFGTTGTGVFSQGDFNYDGNVNLADFGILRASFGTTLATPMASLFADEK